MWWLWLLGYIAVGLACGRIYYLVALHPHADEEEKFIFPIAWLILWPLGVACFAILATAWGLGQLVSMPPRRERQQRKLQRMQDRISQLEEELNIR